MLNLIDVSAKIAYEWVRTGHWSLYQFKQWLNVKGIHHDNELRFGNILIHRANAQLVYAWIKTKHWNRGQFQNWLNSFL